MLQGKLLANVEPSFPVDLAAFSDLGRHEGERVARSEVGQLRIVAVRLDWQEQRADDVQHRDRGGPLGEHIGCGPGAPGPGVPRQLSWLQSCTCLKCLRCCSVAAIRLVEGSPQNQG